MCEPHQLLNGCVGWTHESLGSGIILFRRRVIILANCVACILPIMQRMTLFYSETLMGVQLLIRQRPVAGAHPRAVILISHVA